MYCIIIIIMLIDAYYAMQVLDQIWPRCECVNISKPSGAPSYDNDSVEVLKLCDDALECGTV